MPIPPKPDGLFDANVIGLETAYLLALENILQNEVDELNTVLGEHALTAPIITATYGGTVTSAHINIGVLKDMWNPADPVNGGPVRIRVCASDFGTSQHIEEERRAISMDNISGGKRTLTASVFLFFHRDVFRDKDPNVQARREEIALTQASYWLRKGVLNNAYYYTLALSSVEQNGLEAYETDNITDTLTQCYARRGLMGRLPEHYGGSEETVGLQFIHSGWIG